MIVAEHLRKTFAGKGKDKQPVTAVDDVSFEARDGQITGLLGPNGAGKTTMMSILAGLSPASGGEVRLAGQVIHPGNREVRALIGLVPQELAVYGSLTAAATVITAPLVLAFLFARRRFIEGITMTGIK